MHSTITLTITTGPLSGRKYIFSDRTTCIIGRNEECNLSIPYKSDPRISRYHCLLDINPPEIRIRDLGSLNGTYINGEKIGARKPNYDADKAFQLRFPEYDLKDSDEIRIGDTVLEISIETSNSGHFHYSRTSEEITKIQRTKTPEILDTMQIIIKLANNGNEKLKVFKDYQIVKLIGTGIFGEVYLLQHTQTLQKLAVKVMLPMISEKGTNKENSIEMFIREIENFKALQHPNIVELWNYNYVSNLFLFTMEYYPKGNIYDLMKQFGGKLPVNMAIGMTLQILDGLIYSHQAQIPYYKLANGTIIQGKGLVHRDLKPNNIFLTQESGKLVAKIGDYGLAKSFDLAGLSGQSFTKTKGGTPGFISRQQVLKFRKPDPSMDVWATAACLYNMLTGYVPRNFTDEPWLDVLQNKPIPILQRDGNVPMKLAEVIDLALTETPEIHFQTAAEFKEALTSVKYLL